ncbi:hypothetical protein DICVIV_08545, partial [Dictyocaulus viviparus]
FLKINSLPRSCGILKNVLVASAQHCVSSRHYYGLDCRPLVKRFDEDNAIYEDLPHFWELVILEEDALLHNLEVRPNISCTDFEQTYAKIEDQNDCVCVDLHKRSTTEELIDKVISSRQDLVGHSIDEFDIYEMMVTPDGQASKKHIRRRFSIEQVSELFRNVVWTEVSIQWQRSLSGVGCQVASKRLATIDLYSGVVGIVSIFSA